MRVHNINGDICGCNDQDGDDNNNDDDNDHVVVVMVTIIKTFLVMG